MSLIPSLLLKQLYTNGSLKNTEKGIVFSLKNRLSDATLTKVQSIKIDETEVPLDDISVDAGNGKPLTHKEINAQSPLDFALKKTVNISANIGHLSVGKHTISLSFEANPFGKLEFSVDDSIQDESNKRVTIPRSEEDDYSDEIIKKRQQFVKEYSGKELNHVTKYSFDAHSTEGNCEHFTGVAQIPLGFAGPLLVNGEYAKGEFLIPMATSEGTLIASYNRGISVLNMSGGVKCTVIGDAMQRAPVFVFEDARGAKEFDKWVQTNIRIIAQHAEATSSIAKLQYIDTYLANKFAYLRFNFSTGDAAGQNMVGRATFAACSWILDTYRDYKIEHFYLESNFATDKKASQVNIMRTRGKRVVAECTIKRDVLLQRMRVAPEELAYHAQVANVGSILSGANNNGAHSANGITAMFIATGQDVANVSESSAGVIYSEVNAEKDLYISITIPSLIVATYGGGTGLATQKECLEVLGCYGKGTVYKFAEIVAGVVLAGEISLASAISSSDWVSSHEKLGRNR